MLYYPSGHGTPHCVFSEFCVVRWSSITIHGKYLVRKNLANKLQSVHIPNTFLCACEYWRVKLKFWWIAHDSPNWPKFPLPNISCVQHNNYCHCGIYGNIGKSVLLEQIKQSLGKVVSHILTSHSGGCGWYRGLECATPPPFTGAIFLQSIPTNRSLHDDAPSISEGWGGKVSDYRIMVSASSTDIPSTGKDLLG